MSGETPAHTRITAARARLVLERPFIGALALHLRPQPASAAWCETVATDGRTLYYNAPYVQQLAFAELQFVLAHQALHCALGHFSRRVHRTVRRWDAACDHAVNLLLIEDGMSAPAGALADARFRGLAAEEIYPLIAYETEERTLDRHLADDALGATGSGANDRRLAARCSTEDTRAHAAAASDTWDDAGSESRSGPGVAELAQPLTPNEREMLPALWRNRTVAAAQHARSAGRLAASWSRLAGDLVQPALPWRALLARHVMAAARDDYSYQRLSRRDGNAILPRLASGEPDVCIAVDTSGSIQGGELAAFAAEIESLKSQIRARVTLLACDERLDPRGPWRYTAWEPIAIPHEWNGGGGTSFAPVFEWVTREQYRPDVLVYFTDAEGDFPPAPPGYPVVWLVKGKAPVPWGERIQLN